MVIVFEGDPARIIEFRHHTPGNLRAMVQAKLKNLRTGSNFEHRFRAADSVEPASMETHELEYLYDAAGTYHFMNTENYEQITIPKELIEDVVGFLTPNLEVEVEFYETTPLNVSLPKTVALKVTQTDPGMKTAAVNNTLKPATMETGLTVQVPHFVQEGETITINTETREYMARAK